MMGGVGERAGASEPAAPEVVHVRPGEHPELAGFLERWHSRVVVRRGELVHPPTYPAFVAVRGGLLVGVLTYDIRGHDCEVATLHVDEQGTGTGTRLLAAVREAAVRAGCRRIWLVTTNDNVRALRFYQRRGLRLSALRPGAVDEARRIKPEIPSVGDHGIPIRDELELELQLPPAASQ